MGGASPSCAYAMEGFPVTAQLGPMAPLLAQLRSFIDTTEHRLPKRVGKADIEELIRDLEEISSFANNVLEAENPSFTASWWTSLVRELSFDMADYFDKAMLLSSNSNGGTPAKKGIPQFRARLKDAIKRCQMLKDGDGRPVVSLVPLLQNLTPQLKDLPDTDLIVETMNKISPSLRPDKLKGRNVLSILGFAAVGKTALARRLYRDYGGRFDCRAFLRVSQNLDIRMLLTSMLSQIKGQQPYHGFPDAEYDLFHHATNHLMDKTCLIVIDELWSTSMWDIIRRAFPEENCKSTIIAITQTKDVALACCDYKEECIFEMGPQQDDEFRKFLFSGIFGSEYDRHQKLKEVLSSEPNSLMKIFWRTQHSLYSPLGSNPTAEGMKETANLIYNNLPPHLKTCLLYLNMYPEGCVIKKDDLVKQWIAEGFVNTVGNHDAGEVAGGYFDELIIRRIIQPVDASHEDEVSSCIPHHTVLDFISYKSTEENFITSVNSFQTTQEVPNKVRRLSIKFGGAKNAKITGSMNKMSQTRSLIFFGFVKCVDSIVWYGLLRVLILHIWADQEDECLNLSTIGELFLLSYLKIECNMTVNLPDKIERLQYLGTMEVDARGVTIPSDIISLPRLLHLRLPSKIDLFHGIGHMTSLRSLGYFSLSNESRDNVLNLGKLTNLWDLHLTCSTLKPGNLKESMQDLGSILSRLSNLKSLILNLVPDSSHGSNPEANTWSIPISCDGLITVTTPPAPLQTLELLPGTFTFSNLPKWIGELHKLRILKIGVEGQSSGDIDVLKRLPTLVVLSLYIKTVPDGGIVVDRDEFPTLKYFKFMCTPPCLQLKEGAMPNVRRLKLRFTAKPMGQYSMVDAGFEHLKGLQVISTKISNGSFDESYRRDQNDALVAAAAKNQNKPVVNVKWVGSLSYGDKQKSIAIQEETQQKTTAKQDEIADEPPKESRIYQSPESSPHTQIPAEKGSKNKNVNNDRDVDKDKDRDKTKDKDKERWIKVFSPAPPRERPTLLASRGKMATSEKYYTISIGDGGAKLYLTATTTNNDITMEKPIGTNDSFHDDQLWYVRLGESTGFRLFNKTRDRDGPPLGIGGNSTDDIKLVHEDKELYNWSWKDKRLKTKRANKKHYMQVLKATQQGKPRHLPWLVLAEKDKDKAKDKDKEWTITLYSPPPEPGAFLGPGNRTPPAVSLREEPQSDSAKGKDKDKAKASENPGERRNLRTK